MKVPSGHGGGPGRHERLGTFRSRMPRGTCRRGRVAQHTVAHRARVTTTDGGEHEHVTAVLELAHASVNALRSDRKFAVGVRPKQQRPPKWLNDPGTSLKLRLRIYD
jgi:hypothetical protein